MSASYVTRLLRLRYLALDIVTAIVEGRQPAALTAPPRSCATPACRWPGPRSGRGWGSRLPPVMMESRVDTQARRPSLATAVWTREREQTRWIPP